MTLTKVWKSGESGQPSFPQDYDVVQKAVLQVTDIKSNHNKYYALELHAAEGAKVPKPCRLFTHYGRTDDLETNPDGGQKECRYFGTLTEAQAAYQSIYREKTHPRKGYREVSLASSRIGSPKARGTSAGEIDARTLAKLEQGKQDKAGAGVGGTPAPAPPPRPALHPGVADLVRYLYAEATSALVTTVAATITARGIETPLGILTVGQVEKGEAILSQIYKLANGKDGSGGGKTKDELADLSGEFYTVIPHRIGRSRADVAAAVINDLDAVARIQETLQLMKDMLQVNGDAGAGGNVLYDAQIDAQYQSLNCDLKWLEKGTEAYNQIESYVLNSRVDGRSIKVQNICALRRGGGEWDQFTAHVDNHRLLFHGSRVQNWVGILSRGILLPKLAVKLGVRRTDAGWLGNGIYFGDAACTSCAYTSPGRAPRKTRLMGVARVALGKMKDYTKITYGLTAPPVGYDSCHGVRGTGTRRSEFSDDEYTIYNPAQHRLEYLVEFTG